VVSSAVKESRPFLGKKLPRRGQHNSQCNERLVSQRVGLSVPVFRPTEGRSAVGRRCIVCDCAGRLPHGMPPRAVCFILPAASTSMLFKIFDQFSCFLGPAKPMTRAYTCGFAHTTGFPELRVVVAQSTSRPFHTPHSSLQNASST
jgi:hypothetical protein